MNKLFKRDFTLVVIGQIISLFGNAILRFALPLYLLRKTDSSSLFGAMCASTMFGVSMMTAAQQQTPPNLLGKIMAVIIAVSSCSQPVGQAVYGVLFDVFADKPYLVMTGAAILAMTVSVYSKKVFAVLEKESAVK